MIMWAKSLNWLDIIKKLIDQSKIEKISNGTFPASWDKIEVQINRIEWQNTKNYQENPYYTWQI